jgi:HlyD family secretion protein
LQPTKSVDVGSELSGTLATVLVQENDQVKKGQLLAQLDTSKLKMPSPSRRRRWRRPKRRGAEAGDGGGVEAALARMRHVAELSGGKVPAKTELETRRGDGAATRRCQRSERPGRRAGQGDAEDGRNQSRQGDHPLAGQWRGADAQGRAGPDGGGDR